MVEKFSKHVHVRRGGLGGWCEHCGLETRRHSLEVLHEEGTSWATISRRLNFLANVANRSNSRGLHVAACEDQRWAAKHEKGHRRTRE